jgi:hypothetical protein
MDRSEPAMDTYRISKIFDPDEPSANGEQTRNSLPGNSTALRPSCYSWGVGADEIISAKDLCTVVSTVRIVNPLLMAVGIVVECPISVIWRVTMQSKVFLLLLRSFNYLNSIFPCSTDFPCPNFFFWITELILWSITSQHWNVYNGSHSLEPLCRNQMQPIHVGTDEASPFQFRDSICGWRQHTVDIRTSSELSIYSVRFSFG